MVSKFGSREYNRIKYDEGVNGRTQRYISDLVSDYRSIEKLCDEETDNLEELCQKVEARISADARLDENIVNLEFEGDTIVLEKYLSGNGDDGRKLDKEAFLERSRAARRFQLPYRIFDGEKFVVGVTDAELSRLEEADSTIQMCMERLSSLETEILCRVPETARDAIEKLRFVSTLFLEVNNVDVDVFAYVSREIALQLGHLLNKPGNSSSEYQDVELES